MDEKNLRVLVVDDERPIRRFLRNILGGRYAVFEAENGASALQAVVLNKPDLVILDLGLPDMDGLEVLQRLRQWTDVPIIILSVRENEGTKVTALDAGADDYLTKPFSTGELMARIRAVLRHTIRSEGEPVYQIGELLVDLTKREVLLAGCRVTLTPTEYDLLRVLVRNTGKVLTHKQLTQAVWGGDYQVDPHLLRVNISNLRQKIEADPVRPHYIITEPGVGYRLKENRL